VLWWHNNKKFQFHIRHDYLENEFAVDDFATGNWQHWVWRRAGKTSCVFLDGDNLGCVASKAGSVSIESLIVGQEQDSLEGDFQSSQRIRGLLDELLIFDKAISDSQIQTIYQNQDAGRRWDKDANPSNAQRACNYSVDHYRLILDDNTGLTCENESMEIQACLDDECSSRYTDELSQIRMIALVDDASVDDITWHLGLGSGNYLFFGRSDSVMISKTEPGKVFYGVYDETEAKNDFRCFVNKSEVDVGDSGECYTEFADAGFKISEIDDHVAGDDLIVTFEALQKGENGACENIFDGNKNIKFTYKPIMPTNASSMDKAFTINDTTISSNTDTEVNVNFDSDNNYKATLNIKYLDAGKISFTALADLPLSESIPDNINPSNGPTDVGQKLTSTSQEGEISASSNAYVVKPRKFKIKLEGHPFTSDGNIVTDAFASAGEDFSFNIEAVNKQDSITTNFNSAEITGALQIFSSLKAPIGGEDGDLTIPTEVTFSDGVAVIENAQFSEVGVINIYARLYDDQYLNHTQKSGIQGSITKVGRFIPAHFSLTEKNVSDGCDGFTYFDQPFDSFNYEIEAQNQQGNVVKNYFSSTDPTKNFARAIVENLIINDEVGNHKLARDLDSRYKVTPTTANWFEGKYTFEATNAVLKRDNTALSIGTNDPMAQLYPLVRLIDPDGKKLNDLDQNANKLSSGTDDFDSISLVDGGPLKMRFGRLVVGNNYGNESEPLQIPLQVEYWNGTSFDINTLDSCSEYSKSSLFIPDRMVDQKTIGTDDEFYLGRYNSEGLGLTAPNEPRIFRVTYDISEPWLQFDWNGDGVYNDADDNPSGMLQFGKYRGHDRVVYWYEN
jgi:MSHA biogenesis protein MshQ